HAVRVDPVPGGDRLDPRGRIAAGSLSRQHDPAELLLVPGREEGGALQRPYARADADRGEIVRDRLGHAEVGRIRREVAAVEAARKPGLAEQLPGAPGIVRVWFNGQGELHVARHDVPREARKPE